MEKDELSADVSNSTKYKLATALEENNDYARAAIAFGKLGMLDYKDSLERSMGLWDKVARRHIISSTGRETLILLEDGTVKQLGYDYEDAEKDVIGPIAELKDIISVNVPDYYDFNALTSNGTVINKDGSDRDNVVTVCGASFETAYLLYDGTVEYDGNNDDIDVSQWKNIIDIDMSNDNLGPPCIVGLKADGTAIASGTMWSDEVSKWTDIVQIGAGTEFIVGLKADGTVLFCGDSYGNMDAVTQWSDIASISCSDYALVGLKKTGA